MSENTEQKPQVVDKRRFVDAAFEPRLCLNCGHEERFSDNEGGKCEKIADEEGHFCGCTCRFFDFSPSSDPNKPIGMDFSTAIREVIQGKRVTRLEWGNPEIWLMMFYWGQISPKQPAGKYLSIHHADGAMNPLVVIEGDLAGNDWVVVV